MHPRSSARFVSRRHLVIGSGTSLLASAWTGQGNGCDTTRTAASPQADDGVRVLKACLASVPLRGDGAAPTPVWCGRRASNPHDFRHGNLNPARLPIPPRPLWHCLSRVTGTFRCLNRSGRSRQPCNPSCCCRYSPVPPPGRAGFAGRSNGGAALNMLACGHATEIRNRALTVPSP